MKSGTAHMRLFFLRWSKTDGYFILERSGHINDYWFL